MQFGRVEGFLTRTPRGELRITVLLDNGRRVATVRDDAVPTGLQGRDHAWLADQLVQETLGNELAKEGWEVIGEASSEDAEEGASALARSSCYVVRRV
ncbi:MAG TPA: hypothetical protein VM450_10300 [Thermomicrobiales bacterium]|nr:hypothetical protein [Thermomicrobiales bacterium]